MKSSSVYRDAAREKMKGNWATGALFAFVYLLISGMVSNAIALPFAGNQVASSSTSFLSAILVLPLGWAFGVAFLRQFRNEKMEFSMLFEGYAQQRIWITTILQYVYTILWMLLLFIPGIIKSYSYSMTAYILHDNPELSENAAIEESMRLMQGRKMDLFKLDLSFIGWAILCTCTFFIGFLWLVPYMETAHAAFYEDIISEENNSQEYQVPNRL